MKRKVIKEKGDGPAGISIDLISTEKLEELGREKIRFILDHVKTGKVLVLEKGLTATEELDLIRITMSEIDQDSFIGVETPGFTGNVSRRSFIQRLFGRAPPPRMMVVGPAHLLKTIKKGITLEQVVSAVKMTKEAGLIPHASFILGLPGETPETLKETVAFGEKLKDLGTSHGFHLLAPFPGTEVRDNSDDFGIQILTDDWRQYHANRAIVETSTVTREMLDEIVIAWEGEFDRWLGIIKDERARGEASEEDAWQLTRLEHTVLINDLMMGRVIEEKGSWPRGEKPLSEHEALKALVKRVADSVDDTQEQILSTLTFALETGNLRYSDNDGLIKWEWVDFLS